jgi:hypothetical protein
MSAGLTGFWIKQLAAQDVGFEFTRGFDRFHGHERTSFQQLNLIANFVFSFRREKSNSSKKILYQSHTSLH